MGFIRIAALAAGLSAALFHGAPESARAEPTSPGVTTGAITPPVPAPATRPGDAPTPKPPAAKAAPEAAAATDSAKTAKAATPPKPVKKPVVPAKELFGAAKAPAPLAARAIGGYAKGCLAGAEPLAIDGPAWQAMRLSRNRNWGHPRLIKLIEKFAGEVKTQDGWNGLLVGDLAQPRGGPMLTGHASHQIGLDADVWLTPMPDRRLSEKEREEISATSMLAADKKTVDPAIWTPAHLAIVKRAASYRQVARIFVHPAIKKALCDGAGTERGWLSKVRPMWGHNYHFHIRIGCPPGFGGCKPQPLPPDGDGCGKEVEDWIKRVTKPEVPPKPGAKPAKPKPPIMLDQLPAACRIVLDSGAPKARGAGTEGPGQRSADSGIGQPGPGGK